MPATTTELLLKQIITCAAYCNGRRVGDVELNKVHEILQNPDQFVWIALHEPSEEVLERVKNEFGLHELAVEDAHRAHQRPKIEVYGNSLFVVLRTVEMKADQQLEFGETHFFVGILSSRCAIALRYLMQMFGLIVKALLIF
jgi:magnesium transporter